MALSIMWLWRIGTIGNLTHGVMQYDYLQLSSLTWRRKRRMRRVCQLESSAIAAWLAAYNHKPYLPWLGVKAWR